MKHLKTNFKNKAKLTLTSCCIVFMTLTGCSSNEEDAFDCGNGLWTQSVQTELNTWLTAAQTYSQDQSSANCQSYKNSGQAYLNALNKIKECVPAKSLADFEKAIEEAKEELADSSC